MATADTAKAKRARTAIQGGVVAVEVGPERVKHFVHKALLEEHSEYFQKALNGSWKEAEDKAVCLDDVDCGTFQIFVNWLYTRNLPVEDQDWNLEEYQGPNDSYEHVQWYTAAAIAMLKAYKFSDRMISPHLRQALEYELIDFYVDGGEVTYTAVIDAFDHLPPSSAILRAMIDAHCRDYKDANDTEKNGELQLRAQLPNAFLIGVMERFAKVNAGLMNQLEDCDSCGDGDDSEMPARCEYHNHATDKEEKECQRTFELKNKLETSFLDHDDSDAD